MEVQAVYPKVFKAETLVIYKFDLPDASDAADGSVGRQGIDLQADAGGRIQGDAAAARIQNKIQGIRIVIQKGPYDNNAPRKSDKGETRYEPGRGGYKFLLRLCGPRKNKRKQENRKTGQDIQGRPLQFGSIPDIFPIAHR
jgi:hypothetical protein